MSDHSQRRQKSPPSAAHKALRPAPSSSIDGWRPPKQADIFFKEGVYCPQHTPMLQGCIITGTKRCIEGHTPPQHPQNYIRLLRGSSPIWTPSAFPSAAMVVTVFCSVPEHEPLFLVEPRHSGYRQKALVSSKTILALYWGGDKS
jgi:hypothetical protein